MDQRIEIFPGATFSRSRGEEPDAIREGVRVASPSARRSSGCRSRTARLPLDSTSAAKLLCKRPQRRVRVRVA